MYSIHYTHTCLLYNVYAGSLHNLLLNAVDFIIFTVSSNTQKYKDLDGEVIRKNGIILLRELTAEVKNFMDFKMNAVLVSAEIRKVASFFCLFCLFVCMLNVTYTSSSDSPLLFAYLHVIS